MRTPLAWHVTSRLVDDRVITPNSAARRRAAWVIHRQAATSDGALVAFKVVDSHMHLLIAGARHHAGEATRRIEIALTKRLGLPVGFQRARFMPVNDQSHLYNAYRYVLRQEQRHGIGVDQAHDASSLPDVLGYRVLPWSRLAAQTAELLPRLDIRGIDPDLSIDGQTVASLCVSVLAEAAAGAAGLGELGRCRLSTAARRAAVIVAHANGARTRDLTGTLGVGERLVQQLRHETEQVAPALVRAVSLQWRLRSRIAERAELARREIARQALGEG